MSGRNNAFRDKYENEFERFTRLFPRIRLLRSESSSGKCAKLRTVATSNNRVHPTRSFFYCLFAPHIYSVVLRAHSARGEPRIQRNASGKVARIVQQVSQSGLWSRNSNFWLWLSSGHLFFFAPTPTTERFRLRLHNDLVD